MRIKLKTTSSVCGRYGIPEERDSVQAGTYSQDSFSEFSDEPESSSDKVPRWTVRSSVDYADDTHGWILALDIVLPMDAADIDVTCAKGCTNTDATCP
ncbi:hypothetical protein TNCV_687711 [Trichonephila clavipes]|nr:hypothetical protein TNCV_687711 [Trichonephila clavipes]